LKILTYNEINLKKKVGKNEKFYRNQSRTCRGLIFIPKFNKKKGKLK
jgi:hypothetical protein